MADPRRFVTEQLGAGGQCRVRAANTANAKLLKTNSFIVFIDYRTVMGSPILLAVRRVADSRSQYQLREARGR